MRFNLFGWLRAQVAEAVISSVSDGIAAISDPEAPPAPDLAALRARAAESVAAKALPVAEERPVKKK